MNRSGVLLSVLGLAICAPSLAQYTATQIAQFQDCVRIYSATEDQESCFRRNSLLNGKTGAELLAELSELAGQAEEQRNADEERQRAIAERQRSEAKACIDSAGLPSDEAALVYEKRIRIGMSEAGLLCSWGNPKTVNRSVGPWGVRKQHVYDGDVYVYVENGIVISWQD